MASERRPTALFILDGLAHNPNPESNAVFSARKPTLDRIWSSCPYTELITFGSRVGLPEGQMGNSEVGHLNIGGGRIVKQELTLINEAVESGSVRGNPELKKVCLSLNSNPDAALHVVGLVSRGGVHSSSQHILALVEACLANGVKRIFLHAISDGRDRPPTIGREEVLETVTSLNHLAEKYGACVCTASLIGRYWAMDRDKRWDRTKRAYDLFTDRVGVSAQSVEDAFDQSYNGGTTDEFIEPFAIDCPNSSRTPAVLSGDAVLFANFRADRMRQIVRSFFDQSFCDFERAKIPQCAAIAGLTEYEDDFPIATLFRPQEIKNHFGQVVASAGLAQLRLAETEKYPHVTYFFNGGDETPCAREERILVPSPRDVPTYDLKPQMSALEVTEELLAAIDKQTFDAFVVNFANCDMVGHTGSFEAAVKAVETVDSCLGRILQALEKQNGVSLVTADHGNADQMIDYDTGEPHTYHTTHPVPFSLVGADFAGVKLRMGGALCDIAPTLCEVMQLKQPSEMTGRSLIE
ncbi:MAG: 2,3-bisphosphoglycerate-independent phosphoglycerate mutase [Bdellovibrionales bacterium]|nr:2,3-bisphosphoglycerate-independent phosphoglycerate mutase [Bdellovibrionales bacterium]